MVIKLLIPLLLISFVSANFMLGCNSNKITEEENSVMPNTQLPPIDTSVPAEMETATFALG